MNRALAVILTVWGLTGAAAAESRGTVAITAEQRTALGIMVGRAEARDLVAHPRLPGRITLPNARMRMITARSSGVLLSLSVAVGDTVEVGQELARLESPAVVSLQREYLEALSQLDLARSTAKREEQLAEEGIIAGRRAMESASFLREAKARLEERKQALALAGMDTDELSALLHSRDLQSTLILRAPLAGVVLEQYARAGQRLDAGGTLYRIGDVGALMVEIHVPLDVANFLEKGTGFVLPEQGAAGRVVTVGSEVHSLDQGVLVRGELVDRTSPLRPGQFVRVQFETPREHGSAYTVPSTAVVHADGRAWVFREVETGFSPVPIKVVGGGGRESVIVGELAGNANVAIRGTAALKALWLANGGPS